MIELGGQIASFIAEGRQAAKSVTEARAAEVAGSESYKGRVFVFLQKHPTRVYSFAEISEATLLNSTNLSVTLLRLVRDGLILKERRGHYRAINASDEDRAPRPRTATAINPDSVKGRLLELVNAKRSKGKMWTIPDFIAALKCSHASATLFAHELAKDGALIREKRGVYRAVTEADEEGVRF